MPTKSTFLLISIFCAIFSIVSIKLFHDRIILKYENQLKKVLSINVYQKKFINNSIRKYQDQLLTLKSFNNQLKIEFIDKIKSLISEIELHSIAIDHLIEDYQLSKLEKFTTINDKPNKIDDNRNEYQGEYQVYHLLRKSNILDNYMIEIVDDVVNRLMLVANNWKGYQINGAYKPDMINIYLFNRQALPNNLILPIGQPNLNLSYVVKTGVVDEESKIILIDTCLFKEFIASTFLHVNRSTSFANAVAMVQIYGLEKFENLWSPLLNRSLTKKHEKLNYLFRGMVALIIGYEMGHIYFGKKSYTQVLPTQFKGQDKYRQFACSSILDKSYQERREVKDKCDHYCVSLLSKILFPKNIFNNQYLWYELGSEWFALYSLYCKIIPAYTVFGNNKFLYLAGLDNNLVKELSRLKRKNSKVINVLFPLDHPSSFKRLTKTLNLLRKSKYSINHGKRFFPDPIATILDCTLQQECEKLQQMYEKQNKCNAHKERELLELEHNNTFGKNGQLTNDFNHNFDLFYNYLKQTNLNDLKDYLFDIIQEMLMTGFFNLTELDCKTILLQSDLFFCLQNQLCKKKLKIIKKERILSCLNELEKINNIQITFEDKGKITGILLRIVEKSSKQEICQKICFDKLQ